MKLKLKIAIALLLLVLTGIYISEPLLLQNGNYNRNKTEDNRPQLIISEGETGDYGLDQADGRILSGESQGGESQGSEFPGDVSQGGRASGSGLPDTGSPGSGLPDIDFPDNQETSITLCAVGDIITHTPQVNSARVREGKYDFDKQFKDIKPYIEGSDISICNFETTIGKPYSGYPRFKSPAEVVDSLKYAGFDVLTTANNHCLDGYESGLVNTINEIKKRGLLQTGTFDTEIASRQVLMTDVKGIKLAILAYTYGCNGNEASIPDSRLQYMVNMLSDEESIERGVRNARAKGADMVIAAVHWGDEDVRTPNGNQIAAAKRLVAMGVDIILGSHPHILQKIEMIDTLSASGEKRSGMVIYSLGNFISNQQARYNDSGMVLQIEIKKRENSGSTAIGEVRYVPTWVYKYSEKGKPEYRVLPVLEHMNDKKLPSWARKRLKQVWKETTSIFGFDRFKPGVISGTIQSFDRWVFSFGVEQKNWQ